MMQKHYWVVEIEGFDWTKKRKIWNKESALATYSLDKSQADMMGRKIELFYVDLNGAKRKEFIPTFLRLDKKDENGLSTIVKPIDGIYREINYE